MRDRIHRNEVDVGEVAPKQMRKRIRIDVGVVHTGDHHVLVAHSPARYTRMIASGRHHFGHRPAAVQRHENVPESVTGGVQADRQSELRAELGEASDAGYDPRG